MATLDSIAASPEVMTLADYLRAGGYVVIPILLLAVVLWFLVGLRLAHLRRGIPRSAARWSDAARGVAETGRRRGGVLGRALVAALDTLRRHAGLAADEAADALDAVFLEEEQGLGRFRRAIRAITAVAPLLGLLGTVSGMIETFDSLTDMTLFSETGGVAGGISEALVTTQLGLFVAIPGLIVGRLLDQREDRLRKDLEQLKHVLLVDRCASAARPLAGGQTAGSVLTGELA